MLIQISLQQQVHIVRRLLTIQSNIQQDTQMMNEHVKLTFSVRMKH